MLKRTMVLMVLMVMSLSSCAEPNNDPIVKWWGTGHHQPKETHQDRYLLEKTVYLAQCLGLNAQEKYVYKNVNQNHNPQLHNPRKWGLMLHSGHIKSARQKRYGDYDLPQWANRNRIDNENSFYASIVPYIMDTNNQKYLLMPLVAKNFVSGLPVGAKNTTSNTKKIGYIPSCQPLGSLPNKIKEYYQVRMAYYPTATFLFKPPYTEVQTIQQEIQSDAEEIILTERVVDSNVPLNHLTLKGLIQELVNSSEPDRTFAQLRHKNIEKYCFAGVNCRDGINVVYHTLPTLTSSSASQPSDLNEDNTSSRANNNATSNPDGNPYPWLSGNICDDDSIQYQYNIVEYKVSGNDAWIRGTIPPNDANRLKLNQQTNYTSLQTTLELDILNQSPVTAFNGTIQFNTENFRVKQGTTEIANELIYYNTLADCRSRTNSEENPPTSVNACTTVRLGNQCKQSQIQQNGAVSERIFQFPTARLSIQYPTSWGDPVIQNCVHSQQQTRRSITTKTCDQPASISPQITFKWRHYQPLEITRSMTRRDLLGVLQPDMGFLQGQTLCGEDYQYHYNVTANINSIYPLVFKAGLSSNNQLWKEERIQKTTIEAAVKQKYQAKATLVRGIVVDSSTRQHRIKLLDVSTLGKCRKAPWNTPPIITNMPNNQQKTYNMMGLTSCPKFAKIDNIESSCTQIQNNEFKFEFKPFQCSTGQRHLIVIERGSNLASKARMIRKALLNVLSTKLHRNTRIIPAFDIVGLDNGADIIWRCEDFIQPQKPVNALLAKFKTRLNKKLRFQRRIARNPLDNFRFVKQELSNNSIKIRQLESILYLNSGRGMTGFTDDDLDEAQNDKLKAYVSRYELPIYLLQTDENDCRKMEQYTSAEECQVISQDNLEERLNHLFN